MYEDRPERATPQAVNDELLAYGLTSPDGQPIWRLVKAELCRVHCFGTRNHIQKGKLEAYENDEVQWNEKQEAEIKETRLIEPDRIEVGEHWIPRYKFKGWVLQRWFPASVWGSRENWEGQRARDERTRLLAAYPSRGDYLMMAGPWPTILQAGDLKGAIRVYNLQQRSNPDNWANHLQAMTTFEKMERQQAADAYAEELAAQHRLGVGSVLRSVSSSAQKFRNIVAKHTAGGINLGASEQWG